MLNLFKYGFLRFTSTGLVRCKTIAMSATHFNATSRMDRLHSHLARTSIRTDTVAGQMARLPLCYSRLFYKYFIKKNHLC